MAYNKSLEVKRRKHGNNLGYVNNEYRKKAISRFERALRKLVKQGIPEGKLADNMHMLPSHIIMNAHIAKATMK